MFGSKKITCLVTPGLLKTSFILNPVLQYITVLLELVICFERLMMRCMLHKLFHDMKPRLEQEKATEQNNRITTITPHHHQHQRSWCWMAMQIVVPTQPLTELVGAAHEVQDHFFLPVSIRNFLFVIVLLYWAIAKFNKSLRGVLALEGSECRMFSKANLNSP